MFYGSVYCLTIMNGLETYIILSMSVYVYVLGLIFIII